MLKGTNPPKPLFQNSAVQLASGLREGAFSARRILDHFLTRIERLNPQVNAFVELSREAEAAADESDARFRAGRPRSILDGIPIAIKDNLLVQGCSTAWGSPLYANRIADHDEVPVARLLDAGAVVLGKTNVPELALSGYTDNPVFGMTRNPWDLACTPGGSSGGAVAAVAAGLAPAALATDGGGSIRRPCAYTGLVGLKPTAGRIRRGRGLPQLIFDFEVVGPIARHAADVRATLQVLAPGTRANFVTPKRARILFVERFGTAPVDPGITDHCREAADELRNLGHDVTAGQLPFEIETANTLFQKFIHTGLTMLARREPRFIEVSAPDFVEQAKLGEAVTGAEYAEMLERLFAFRLAVAEAFDRIDIIMTPAAAAQPWPAAEPYPPVIAGTPVGPRGHAVFTGWVNACGHPAIAIPARPDPDGMPVGFQLVGAQHCDELLLDIAEEFEVAHQFANRWPEFALT